MRNNALRNVKRFFPTVEHVKDATKDITVEVTKRDNSSAAVKKHKNCAMAVACKRKLDADGVVIALSTAYVIKGTTAIRYKVPESVSREIISFDRNGGFEVGEYDLKAPGPGRLLGEKGGNGSKTGKKPQHPAHATQNVRTSLKLKESGSDE